MAKKVIEKVINQKKRYMKEQEIKTTAITISTPDLKKLQADRVAIISEYYPDAKEQAEKKAIAEKEALRQIELSRSDSEKVKELVNDLVLLKGKYSFKSEKNQKMYSEAGILIDKTIEYILK